MPKIKRLTGVRTFLSSKLQLKIKRLDIFISKKKKSILDF